MLGDCGGQLFVLGVLHEEIIAIANIVRQKIGGSFAASVFKPLHDLIMGDCKLVYADVTGVSTLLIRRPFRRHNPSRGRKHRPWRGGKRLRRSDSVGGERSCLSDREWRQASVPVGAILPAHHFRAPSCRSMGNPQSGYSNPCVRHDQRSVQARG
uniref:RC211 n=1 Tax=Ruegeria sp. PR1b TaxID=185588 RepID=Q8KVX9_9RHOB|nr:RC211 [Ruegeria sp. PR1b]